MDKTRTYDFEKANIEHLGWNEWCFYWDEKDEPENVFFYIDLDTGRMTQKSHPITSQQEQEAILRMACYYELVKISQTGNKYHDELFEIIEDKRKQKRLTDLGLLP